MPLVELGGALLAGAVWGLCSAAILPALPRPVRLGLSSASLHDAARALAVASSLALAGAGGLALAGVPPRPLEWWPGLPGDPFTIGADALAAPFLLLTGVVAAAAFAASGRSGDGAQRGERARLALTAGFVAALATAIGAEHALLFLLAWEGMTLLSALLVASDTQSARSRQAAYVYLTLSQIGAACLAFALLQLSVRAGSFRFDDLAATLALLPAPEAHRIVWLASFGAAVKLGLVPLHAWLPLAHPEAPAPVSAILSGAMVKAGLYALLRFGWQLPVAPPPAWGTVLVLAGALTTLVGALAAVVESDAKRLLAFSTVKHAGLLALALGVAARLAADGRTELASLALAACLYHAFGHGIAKAAAFLSVGGAVHAAHSRDLEQLGGLAKRLPLTSVAALVSVVALAGAPLFSCFAGEWMLFQAMILGYSAGSGELRLLVPFAGAGLALATALAAAALVKLYGIAFLGRPRTPAAAEPARERRGATAGALALAALVVAWGAAAPVWLPALTAPMRLVLGPEASPAGLVAGRGLVLVASAGAPGGVSPVAVLALLLLFVALAFAWGTLRGLRGGVRRAPSWSCGVALGPRMQYSALGFTKPLRLIFAPVLRNENEMEVLEQGAPYFAKKSVRHRGVGSFVEERLYQPLVQGVLWASEQARRVQAGDLHVYLAYVLVTLVLLLVFAR